MTSHSERPGGSSRRIRPRVRHVPAHLCAQRHHQALCVVLPCPEWCCAALCWMIWRNVLGWPTCRRSCGEPRLCLRQDYAHAFELTCVVLYDAVLCGLHAGPRAASPGASGTGRFGTCTGRRAKGAQTQLRLAVLGIYPRCIPGMHVMCFCSISSVCGSEGPFS